VVFTIKLKSITTFNYVPAEFCFQPHRVHTSIE